MKKFHEPDASLSAGKILLVIVLLLLGTVVLGSALATFVVALLGSPTEFSKNTMFSINMLPFLVAFLIVLLSTKLILKKGFSFIITSRPKVDYKRIILSSVLWLVILLSLFIFAVTDSSGMIHWNYNPDKFWLLLGLCVIFTPIQTAMEEVLFRSLLFKLFGTFISRGFLIVLLTALMFGAIHLGNPEVKSVGWFAVFFYVFSGLFTGLITLMDDGIELSWGFHLANNIFGILVLTNDWQVLRTDAIFIDHSPPAAGWDMILMLVLFYPLMLFIFTKVYRWNNWKERLFGSTKETDK